jgi:hypothetical protein
MQGIPITPASSKRKPQSPSPSNGHINDLLLVVMFAIKTDLLS